MTGPIGDAGLRGYALWDSWFDLEPLGYEEDEYFISGRAKNSTAAEPSADYTTRIIVTRPKDAKDFNGTVLLDWVNVTAQFENAVDVVEAHEFLLREGYAYVHVSAQSAGICCTPLTPKVWDPIRYADLSHPGDAFAFDMFSQVAKAIRSPDPAGPNPMGDLVAEKILASGQSQSAGRLNTYLRQWQPSAGVIDGFLIHGGGGKTFDAAPPAPVLHLLSDAEASPTEPTHDGENYRLWEIAGSAHSDFWIGYHQEVGQGPRFLGAPKRPASADEELHEIAGNYGEQPHPLHAACILAGGAFPTRYAVSSAIHHLNAWVSDGVLPPKGDRFTFSGGSLARDGFRNALGGIRLPPVDVPVARYESTSCALGGITIPFTELELIDLYGTHDNYYEQMVDHTRDSVAAGFLLPEDAVDLLERACAARNRWLDLSTEPCETPEEPVTIVPFDVVPETINASKAPKNGFPVAFLSTSSFDATEIDPSSVCVFEDGTDPEPSPPCGLISSSVKDHDGDGLDDLVLRFDANQTPMSPGEDKTICGSGTLRSGSLVRGCDDGVKVV